MPKMWLGMAAPRGLAPGHVPEMQEPVLECRKEGSARCGGHLKVSDMDRYTEDSDSIYAFCYEGNRQIVTDRDEERTGAPCCDGICERCDKSWGDA
jgi:hypothetical protein